MNFAYKRAGTKKQDMRRQEEAFKGINIDREYCDKLSGAKAERLQPNKLRLDYRIAPGPKTRALGAALT